PIIAPISVPSINLGEWIAPAFPVAWHEMETAGWRKHDNTRTEMRADRIAYRRRAHGPQSGGTGSHIGHDRGMIYLRSSVPDELRRGVDGRPGGDAGRWR